MRKVVNCIIIILIFLGLLFLLGRLVSYKYIHSLKEGSFVSDYYKEENKHAVIILGDCEAYTTFSPMEMYKEYGITSYIRGNSQQLIGQSYYLLSEALHYEIPKVVILSVDAMRYNSQIKEEYNRLLLDKMRWSKEKLALINYSKMPGESLLTYLFPILRYHERITSLEADDLKYLFSDEVVSHNGFLINKEIKPVKALPTPKYLDDYTFSQDNYNYLDKIRLLCEEKGIKLILYKAPTVHPYWYKEYDKQIKDYANKYQIDYYNMLELEEIGIDMSVDTYDSGTHLNLFGARKVSHYFGKILQDKYNLSDESKNDKIRLEYEKKLMRYEGEVNEKNN